MPESNFLPHNAFLHIIAIPKLQKSCQTNRHFKFKNYFSNPAESNIPVPYITRLCCQLLQLVTFIFSHIQNELYNQGLKLTCCPSSNVTAFPKCKSVNKGPLGTPRSFAFWGKNLPGREASWQMQQMDEDDLESCFHFLIDGCSLSSLEEERMESSLEFTISSGWLLVSREVTSPCFSM